jgi:hypothetical protein
MNDWFDTRHTGILSQIIGDFDPRPVKEQIASNYAHGGGWDPFEGFTLNDHEKAGEAFLQYPNDPPMREVARTMIRDELVILFDYSWVAVVQLDGDWAVTRMD